MRKQDYIIALIKSLTPNEKRFFKLFANIRPGEKDYLRLYDALENKDRYNSEELRAELNVTADQLKELKRYLQLILLRSIRNHSEHSSRVSSVFIAKDDAITLKSKRLFEPALDVTDKGLAEAWELELFEAIPEFLLIKLECVHILMRFDELESMAAERKRAMEALNELMEMQELRGRAMELTMAVGKKNRFDEILNHPLLRKKPSQLKSLSAQICWFAIVTYSQKVNGTPLLELKNARAELEHYKNNKNIFNINLTAYLSCYTRVADAECNTGSYQKSLNILAELKALLKPSDILKKPRIDAFMFYINLSTARNYRLMQRFDEALAVLDKLIKDTEGRAKEYLFEIKLGYAIIYFHKGELQQANDVVDELMRWKEQECSSDLTYLRPLLIAIQLQMGNYSLIPYLIKSAKAWMKRTNSDHTEYDLFFKHTYAIARSAVSDRTHARKEMQQASAKGLFGAMGSELQFDLWLKRK